jgi:hypothetical protein
MFKKDFLLNEAQKFAELLAKLGGLKAEGKYVEYNQQFNDLLHNEYNAEINTLLALTEDDFINTLQSANYSAEKLNALGQLLYVYAQPFKPDDESRPILKKVLIIFDLLEQKHNYHSFENIEQRKLIYKMF